MLRHIALLTVALITVVGTKASAQDVPHDPVASSARAAAFEDLLDHVRPGDQVQITKSDGQTISGRIARITADSVTLEGHRRPRTIEAADVARIGRKDSLKEGFFWGALGGVVVSEMLLRGTCGPTGYDPECRANAGLLLVPVGIGIGIGAGVLTDAARR
jgi:hypothetical protein